MVPVQGPSKYPASPMLARAKFLTSRSRKSVDPQTPDPNADNASVKTAKSEEHLIGEEFDQSESSNKKNTENQHLINIDGDRCFLFPYNFDSVFIKYTTQMELCRSC